MTNNIIPMLVNGKSLGPLILTNNWSFRTNILNISLDRNFAYVRDIVMGIRSVSPTTLNAIYRSSSKSGHSFETLQS